MSRRVQPELLFLARGWGWGCQLLWPRMRGLRPMTRFMFLLRLSGEPLPLQDLLAQRVVLEHGHVAHVPGIVAVARRFERRRRLLESVAVLAPLSRQHLRKRLVADVDPRHRVGETFLCEGLAHPLGPVL